MCDPRPGDISMLGKPLRPCSTDPLTGFYRTGACSTGPEDVGSHTVCATMTRDFLAFSLEEGNDLVTPRPAFQFPGLQPGMRWCVCVARWEAARLAGVAPPVHLASTHQNALRVVKRAHLMAFAAQG